MAQIGSVYLYLLTSKITAPYNQLNNINFDKDARYSKTHCITPFVAPLNKKYDNKSRMISQVLRTNISSFCVAFFPCDLV